MPSTKEKKIALFPGSFDPFTLGHDSIVRRGLDLVDEVIISVGVNDSKKSCFSLEDRIRSIENIYRDEPRVRVLSYDTLTVDFAETVGAKFILRGIRTVNDFEYEKNIADVNRALSGIETFILFTEPQYAHISSSIVRELMKYGKDISEFLPKDSLIKKI
jgi:pantetheine-phosphate adenylyltransferase